MKSTELELLLGEQYMLKQKPPKQKRAPAKPKPTPREELIAMIDIQIRMANGEAVTNPKNNHKPYSSWFNEDKGEVLCVPKYGNSHLIEWADNHVEGIPANGGKEELLMLLRRNAVEGKFDARLEALKQKRKGSTKKKEESE